MAVFLVLLAVLKPARSSSFGLCEDEEVVAEKQSEICSREFDAAASEEDQEAYLVCGDFEYGQANRVR